jgi:group I intron endonuclease
MKKEQLVEKIKRPFGIIYKVINIINGMCYIGQTTKTLKKRKNCHLAKSRKNKGWKFHNAIREYGEENFLWEILYECSSILEMEQQELYYIRLNDSVENGYNSRYSNTCITEDIRQKLSKSNKGRKLTQEQKDHLSKVAKQNWIDNREKFNNGIKNRSYYGDKISEIKKKGFSDGTLVHGMKGKHHTEETKNKMCKKAKERNNVEGNPMYGKKHSNNTKNKISEISKKRKIKTRLKYPLEIIQKALDYHHNGYSYRQISKIINCSPCTIGRWCINGMDYYLN